MEEAKEEEEEVLADYGHEEEDQTILMQTMLDVEIEDDLMVTEDDWKEAHAIVRHVSHDELLPTALALNLLPGPKTHKAYALFSTTWI